MQSGRTLEPVGFALAAVAAAVSALLLLHPIQLFPGHQFSVAAMPVLAVALVAGPVAGGIAALAVGCVGYAVTALSPLLVVLLVTAPFLGLQSTRRWHPAVASLLLPTAAALLAGALGAHESHPDAGLTADFLQASISVICAFGLAFLVSSRLPHRGAWSSRPLTHRLFVTLSTVATVLTVGLGMLSVAKLQERHVRNTLENLQLLALEAAESTQVLLRAHGRSLLAFGASLSEAELAAENPALQARVEAYAASQLELLSVLLARADGDVIAAAKNRRSLDARAVLTDNVADRDYFRGAIAAGAPYVTDTFRGRGFGSDIIVGISAPILRDGQLLGVIEGSLNLPQLSQVLDSASSRRGLDIVLVDRANRVVADRGTRRLETGQAYVGPVGAIRAGDVGRIDLRVAQDGARLVASARLQPYGWTIHVAQPLAALAPAFEAQFHMVVRDLTAALLAVFGLSIVFAGLLARPLDQFARALVSGSGLTDGDLLASVRGASLEVRRFALALVRAQRRQRRGLRRQQQLVTEKDRLNQELQQLNVELDQLVEARTRVLADRERQLRSSETRWRTMAEIAPDAVVVIDEDNVIQFVNSRLVELSGLTAEELVGQSLEAIIPPRLRGRHHGGLTRYLGSGRRSMNWRATEALMLQADGGERPVEIAFGEYSLDGRRYFAGYLRDIAARKQYEAEVLHARDLAEAANRSKDAFLATMSHEIRTPLHGLIGTLDLMARDPLQGPAAFRLDVARNSARALLQLANDVLDLSGIEAGRVRIDRVAFDLRDLVSGVVTSFEPGAIDKGLRLEQCVAADVPGWVEGDPLRLRQILANLVNNALKFTPTGAIALSVHRKQDEVTFDVTDSGIGVPEDKHEHIFDRFAQAEDERTRRFGGAGLGLAISRLLARAMGGDLTLATTGPQGSTFRLRLPLPQAASLPADEPTGTFVRLQGVQTARGIAPPRILVVDDTPANRYVVEAYLLEMGAEPVLVDGADAGLAELDRGHFDLVLMDVQMPGKDGYQATREIRARPGQASLPVVAMTANANLGERARCEQAGMNDLLVKPFDAAQLRSLLQRILDAAAARAAPGLAELSVVPSAPLEPLLDTSSVTSVARRFADRPGTLRRLFAALQESIALHLEAIRQARAEDAAAGLATALHALKGAAGMYGATRLHREAKALEATVVADVPLADLAAALDEIDRTGRDTAESVARLLETLRAAEPVVPPG